MTKKLKELFERAERWPQEAQDRAVDSLLAIEKGYVHHGLSEDDREALERSEEDIRQGRFGTAKQIAELFERHRQA
jgi:hypothetical protein